MEQVKPALMDELEKSFISTRNIEKHI
jgi:hypothetical protein